jgi:hypothetical protein
MAFALACFRLKTEGRNLPGWEWVMKRILAAALIVTFACAAQGGAHGQSMGQGAPGEMKGGRGHRGANDYKKEDVKPKVDEQAYKEALQKIPDSKEKYDPWGGVRSDNAVKPKQPAKQPAK